MCLFVDGTTAFLSHPQLHSVSIHSLSLAEPILSASLGNHHALLLGQSGHVYCAGSSGILQNRLQFLDAPLHFTPLPDALESVEQVLCGSAHCLALTSTGDLYCWGENAAGQVPDCSVPFVATPQHIASCVSLIAACGDHSSFVADDGIYYWPFYRSVKGEQARRISHPMRVNTLYFMRLQVVQIACHDGFNTILTEKGQLYGYYYFVNERLQRSPAAQALFPSSLDPGCIFALLPAIVPPPPSPDA